MTAPGGLGGRIPGRHQLPDRRWWAILVVFCLPLFVVSCVSVTTLLQDQAQGEQLDGLSSDAALTSAYVAAQVSGLRDVVAAWSSRTQVQAAASSAVDGALPAVEVADARQLVASLRLARTGIATSFLVDAREVSLANAPVEQAANGSNFAYREWFRQATATRAPYVTSAYRSVAVGRPWVVAAAAPVFASQPVSAGDTSSGAPRLVGVLVATMTLTAMQAFTDAYGRARHGQLSIIDAQSQVLASTGRAAGGEHLARDLVSSRLHGTAQRLPAGPAAALDSADGSRVATLAAGADVAGLHWSVVVSRPVSVALASAQRSVWLVRICTAAVLLGLLLAWWGWWQFAGRRQREQARIQQRFRAIYAASPTGIVEFGLDDVIVRCNAAFTRLLGLPVEEIIGRHGWEFFHPDGPPPDLGAIEDLTSGRRASYSAQRLLRGGDGSAVAVQLDWAAIEDDHGIVVQLVCVVSDISVQAHAMSQLHEQRAAVSDALAAAGAARDELAHRQSFTDALLDTIDVGIVSCDADGANLVRNQAERAMLALPAQHARTAPHDAATLIHVQTADGVRVDPGDYPLARALRGETVGAVDFTIGPAGGPYRDVVIRGSQLTTPDGILAGAVVALTDVTAERTATRALALERERLAEAQRLGQLGSFSYDAHSGHFDFSEQIYRIWGLPPDADLATLRMRMIHPDDLARVIDRWNVALAEGGRHASEYRIVRPDGSVRHLQVAIEVTLDAAGDAVHLQGTHLDITNITLAQRAAVEASTLFEAILAAVPDYIFVTDIRTEAVVYGSPGTAILGITSDRLRELGPRLIATLVHPDDQPRIHTANVAAVDLADEEVLQLRYRARHADGTWHWLSRRVTPFHRDATNGQVTEVLGVLRDVTDLVEAEQRLTHNALHDPLTGLPNRGLLIDRLDTALARAEQNSRDVIVLYCDLDGFKHVNDTAGHAAGDAVLVETAARLTAAMREHDTIARVGGDEFVILVEPWKRALVVPEPGTVPGPDPDDPEDPEDVIDDEALAIGIAGRITLALSRPITVDGVEHVITASIGITLAGGHSAAVTVTADSVLHTADTAMYRAKRAGKNQFAITDAPFVTHPR